MNTGDVLTKRPIQTVDIEISAEYLAVCEQYLLQQNCTITHVEGEIYDVFFPEGTREEQRAGASGHYTEITYIVLPSGTELTKYVALPVNRSQKRRTTLAFPKGILK